MRASSNRAAAARASQERQAALRYNSTSTAEQQRLWDQATALLRDRSAPASAPSAGLTSPRNLRPEAPEAADDGGSDAKVPSAPPQILDSGAIEAEVLRLLIDGDSALTALESRTKPGNGGAPRSLRFTAPSSSRRGYGGAPDDDDDDFSSSASGCGDDADIGASSDDLAARLPVLLQRSSAASRRAHTAGQDYMGSPDGLDDLTDYALAGHSTAMKGCTATRHQWKPDLYMRSTACPGVYHRPPPCRSCGCRPPECAPRILRASAGARGGWLPLSVESLQSCPSRRPPRLGAHRSCPPSFA